MASDKEEKTKKGKVKPGQKATMKDELKGGSWSLSNSDMMGSVLG